MVPLQPGIFYHIYNRGVNGETIFREERNYDYFLNLYSKHIQPVADTFEFCLLPNHFHFLVEVKNLTGLQDLSGLVHKKPSQAFSILFNAYSKSINKAYKRTGPLFERPFKRIPISESTYFSRLLVYIHQNPQRHGLIDDFRLWPYSSFGAITGNEPTFIRTDVIRDWFGDVGQLINSHNLETSFNEINMYVGDD